MNDQTMTYDPDAVKTWANEALGYIEGGAESMNICSQRFAALTERLVQPNVWCGEGAKANYHQFLKTHQSMLDFGKSFAIALADMISEVNVQMGNLEDANLAANNATSSFGTLTYPDLEALAEVNVRDDIIRYNYNEIMNIASELNGILNDLDDVKEKLIAKLAEIGSGKEIWDGLVASDASQEIQRTVSNNMDAIYADLNQCIDNINTAGENAQRLDTV